MQEMEFHSISAIFPPMTNDEFQELCESIKKDGLENPIVVYEEKILDGRNRYRACRHVGVEPELVEYDGDDPVGFALRLNLQRRNLTAGQKAVIVEKSSAVIKAEAARRQRGTWADPGQQIGSKEHSATVGVNSPPRTERGVFRENAQKTGRSADESASRAGVSATSIKKARQLLKTADPETIAAVESGEMSLNKAVKTQKPEPTRRELIKELRATIGRCNRLLDRIGTENGTGAKMYCLFDRITHLFTNWK